LNIFISVSPFSHSVNVDPKNKDNGSRYIQNLEYILP